MTGLLWAAVALTAATAGVALALALALAGRVRSLQAQLAAGADPFALPSPGEPVPDFSAGTTAGGRVDSTDLADALIAFFTTDCEACQEVAGELAGGALGGTRKVAIVIGPAAERSAMVDRLAPVADVVEQGDHQGLAARFGVRAFPALLLTGDGAVRASGHALSDLAAVSPA